MGCWKWDLPVTQTAADAGNYLLRQELKILAAIACREKKKIFIK